MVTWEQARQIVRERLEAEWSWPPDQLAVAEQGYQDERWFLVPHGQQTESLSVQAQEPVTDNLEPLVGDPVALVDRRTGELVWLPVVEVPDRAAHMHRVRPQPWSDPEVGGHPVGQSAKSSCATSANRWTP